VTRSSRPYNPYSVLATSITGYQPKVHGVVTGRETMVEANFLEFASQIHENSIFISGGFSKAVSQLLKTKRDGSFYWSNVDKSFVQSQDAVKPLSKDFFVGQEVVSNFFNHFQVNSELKTKAFDQFIAELSFVWNAAKVLKQQSTSEPQFLSFHFDSFNSIATQFGLKSIEFEQVINLADEVLSSFLSQTDYSFELLYLPSVTAHRDIQSILFLLQREFDFSNEELKNYPHLYLPNADAHEKSRICKRLRSYIQTPSTLVFCMFNERQVSDLSQSRIKRGIVEMDENSDVVTNSTYFEPVIYFHLFFWFFLFLIFGGVYAVYLLCSIETDKGVIATSSYVSKVPRK